MNRYELAAHEVADVISDYDENQGRVRRQADAIVDRLVAKGLIQSTEPGDLVPGGLSMDETSLVHKAEPRGSGHYPEGNNEATCAHCGVVIRLVPGGRGQVWVHALTGAVAGPGSPRTS